MLCALFWTRYQFHWPNSISLIAPHYYCFDFALTYLSYDSINLTCFDCNLSSFFYSFNLFTSLIVLDAHVVSTVRLKEDLEGLKE